MGLIEDVVKDVAKVSVEKKVECYVEENFPALMEEAVKNSFSKAIEKRITKELDANLQGMDEVIAQLRDINKILFEYSKKMSQTINTKIQNALNKMEIEFELPKEASQLIGKYLVRATNEGCGDGFYSLTNIMKKKAIDAVNNANIFGEKSKGG